MKLQGALLLVFCGIAYGHPSSPSSFSNWLTLDPHDKFNVSWTVEGDAITFTVTCETNGWVGLGFSPSGSMTEADIIVAWVADDGSSYLLDMYATSNTLPSEDTTKDVTLVSASEANGITTVTFKRKLDTCDGKEDNIITSSTTRLIYAYQLSDPENNQFSAVDYHGHKNRGSKNIYLLDSKTGAKPEYFPDNVETFDFRVNNYHMPAEDTIYYCAFIQPPELEELHHFISIEPLVQEGNEGLVHHILLFACYGLSDELVQNNTKTEGVCETDEMPDFAKSCSTIIHAWAVGGGIFYYPEKTGYPFGGSNGSAPNYYQIQMHYDNPGLLDTFVDSSGLRVTYTPVLREKEAAVLPVGLVSGIAVPPGAEDFKMVAYCDSVCTQEWIPEEGIEIYGYVLHTHLLGMAIQVELYRGKKNIGLLAFDNTYDFNFQETRHMEENQKVLPGDSLKITCTYNSKRRDFVTFGGEGTREEMCFAFLFYYPRQNVAWCSSIPNLYSDGEDPVYADLSVNASLGHPIHALSNLSDWTKDTISILQNGFEETDQYSVCYQENFINHEEMFSPIDKQNYPEMKKVEKTPCYKTLESNDPNSAASFHVTFLLLILLFIFVI